MPPEMLLIRGFAPFIPLKKQPLCVKSLFPQVHGLLRHQMGGVFFRVFTSESTTARTFAASGRAS